jgi:flagellum-specific peptidoglycan hydrolase FlgJ
VNLIKNSPRYRSAVPSVNKNKETMDQFLHDKNYIKSIHQAGYATDPAYSDKVLRVLNTEAIQKQAKSA